MKVVVVGAGYVGLVSAVGLAWLGHTVLCIDNDEEKLKKSTLGVPHFYEPDLARRLKIQVGVNLFFAQSISSEFVDADICILAVGTPQAEDGSADLSFILEAASSVSKSLSKALIVVKSTVPVGTCDVIAGIVGGLEVASNPEFLREGSAIDDFFNPERIVFGVQSKRAESLLRALYDGIYSEKLVMDRRSSELSKYASNVMLATRLALANELARVSRSVGADIEHVTKAVSLDSRIGSGFLAVGPGYGGSCFPKDVNAIASLARSAGVSTPILEATSVSNELQVRHAVEVAHSFFGTLEGKTVAVWGLAFKANTDDTRESPALKFIRQVKLCGATVKMFDPVAVVDEPGCVQCGMYDAAKDADILAIMTE